MFFANEAGGNQFWNSYGPSFMVSSGLGSKSFRYSIIVSAAGAIGGLMGILSSDTIGRRPPAILGSLLLVLWDCLIAALGSRSNITTDHVAQNVVVASFILLIWSTKLAYASQGCELSGLVIPVRGELTDFLCQSLFAQRWVVLATGKKVSLVITTIT